MGYRRIPFVPGEWYHCYSRGIDGRTVFENPRDYERFREALYLSNSKETNPRGNFQHLSYSETLTLTRQGPIVAIGAYCLMPNHFHLLLQEIEEGGISKFMHRVGTSYTMYFNLKRERIGNLFVKPFRSKHIADDRYLKRVAQYIHLNPVALYEPGWKKGLVKNMNALEKKLHAFPHSSLPDYEGQKRKEEALLDVNAMELLREDIRPLSKLLIETREYYAELLLS